MKEKVRGYVPSNKTKADKTANEAIGNVMREQRREEKRNGSKKNVHNENRRQ